MANVKGVIKRVIQSEPAAVRGGVTSVLGVLATIFNIHFASGTVEDIDMLIISVFALISGIWIRHSVVPVSRVMPMPGISSAVVPASRVNDSNALMSVQSDNRPTEEH